MVGSLGTMYKHTCPELHIRLSKWPGKLGRETLPGIHCSPPCSCGDIMEDGANMSKCAFLPVPLLVHMDKEVSHGLSKWKAGSRTLLVNSQKNPRTFNTMHRLLPSRILSQAGVARVSSSFEDSFHLLVAGRMVKHHLPRT